MDKTANDHSFILGLPEYVKTILKGGAVPHDNLQRWSSFLPKHTWTTNLNRTNRQDQRPETSRQTNTDQQQHQNTNRQDQLQDTSRQTNTDRQQHQKPWSYCSSVSRGNLSRRKLSHSCLKIMNRMFVDHCTLNPLTFESPIAKIRRGNTRKKTFHFW